MSKQGIDVFMRLLQKSDLSKLNSSLVERESEILRHSGGCEWYLLQIGIVIGGHY